MKNSKGFTLIEMAIVLVIIGLILGAVTKGKDVIESGKQKKFYNTTIKAWEIALNSWYDRTHTPVVKILNPATLSWPGGSMDYMEVSSEAEWEKLLSTLEEAGLTPPEFTDTAGVVTYKGQELSVTLELWNGLYYLNFDSMPVSLAIALDTIVDGEQDGEEGYFSVYGSRKTAWSDQIGSGETADDATTHISCRLNIL